MVAAITLTGGAQHGLSALTLHEQFAAKNALAKLASGKSLPGLDSVLEGSSTRSQASLHFGLDPNATIKTAGTTAANFKAVPEDAKTSAQTVKFEDNTTIKITGVDVKIHH